MSGGSRVLVVLGTRPEAIKLFPVIEALRAEPGIVTGVCATGQHREMAAEVLSLADIEPDIDLNVMTAGQTLDSLTASLVVKLGEAFDSWRPDFVIVQGDTTSAMVGALSAHYRKIPIGHVEAGLRSGNKHHPWPEEANRMIVGTLADLHFAPTQMAADALARESVPAAAIHVTGNTVIDALLATQRRLGEKPGMAGRLDALMAQVAGRRLIVVTTHRRENHHAMSQIAAALAAIAERDDVEIVFPVHPNPVIRSAMAGLAGLSRVHLIEPQDYPHFVRLLDAATLVLTDSGGIQEEAPALGKPVLVMRETTERPEGVAAGTARLIGTDPQTIQEETLKLLDDSTAYARMSEAHNPYGDGRAAERIARIVAESMVTR